MELIEDLDPEEARAIVAPALKPMMEAVRRCRGYLDRSTGDGIFALSAPPSPTKTILSAHTALAELLSDVHPCLARRRYSSARIA
jgi:class 3 adenylate cyclase